MNYNDFLKGKDVPTIRRLDYIVEETDNMESGYLYAAFRKMASLSMYNNPKLTDERKSAEFEFSKNRIQEKLNWVNDWMAAHNRDEIFTNVDDWKDIGEDYDYFWNLRTEQQFIKEEADARLGLSRRKPLENNMEEYQKRIEQEMEKIKKEQEAPSLED